MPYLLIFSFLLLSFLLDIFFLYFFPFFSSLILTDSTLQKIENILEHSCPKGDELYISDKIGMTKAVLIGTLHGDDVLTASIYKLLTEQMTYQNGIAIMSSNVILVPTAKVRKIIFDSLSMLIHFLFVHLFLYFFSYSIINLFIFL